ncbi:MAG: hypothetical protein JRJ24_21255 [Deltaproteobacteria bacterium]|nr:hypothetical protein [Deltaproteobacteria bacterium]
MTIPRLPWVKGGRVYLKQAMGATGPLQARTTLALLLERADIEAVDPNRSTRGAS